LTQTPNNPSPETNSNGEPSDEPRQETGHALPPLPEDEIDRAIRSRANRLPTLSGGPYFIAPDSAPPPDPATTARINPSIIGVEQVPLAEALNNGASEEFKRLQREELPALRQALRRIGRVAGMKSDAPQT